MSTHTGTRRRSRKASAIIASTAILGIVAGATLATWTITEFVSGSFQTGSSPTDENGNAQSIEGSTDGVSFNSHYDSNSAVALNFGTKNTATLAGNDTVAAPYALRATSGTTITPTITVGSDLTGGAANGLTYSVYTINNLSDCTPNIATAQPAGYNQVGQGTVGGQPERIVQPSRGDQQQCGYCPEPVRHRSCS